MKRHCYYYHGVRIPTALYKITIITPPSPPQPPPSPHLPSPLPPQRPAHTIPGTPSHPPRPHRYPTLCQPNRTIHIHQLLRHVSRQHIRHHPIRQPSTSCQHRLGQSPTARKLLSSAKTVGASLSAQPRCLRVTATPGATATSSSASPSWTTCALDTRPSMSHRAPTTTTASPPMTPAYAIVRLRKLRTWLETCSGSECVSVTMVTEVPRRYSLSTILKIGARIKIAIGVPMSAMG